jgi:hypothetical protein
MMNRLPPPGNGNKVPSRLPPPGHPALKQDFFVRFAELTEIYDDQVAHYKDLKHVSTSKAVRTAMFQLAPFDNDDEIADRLQWLWPDVANIHSPSREHYAQRCSLLVGSFPSAAPHSPKVYTNQLVACVAVRAPSCMVLESACFELTNNYKYSNAPNIADLMTLIDKQEKLWEERLRINDEIQSGRALEYARQRLAFEEEHEQKRINDVVRRLTNVKQLELAEKVREGGIDMVEQATPMLENLERCDRVARRLDKLGRIDLAVKLREGGIDMVDEMEQLANGLERKKLSEQARRRQEQTQQARIRNLRSQLHEIPVVLYE